MEYLLKFSVIIGLFYVFYKMLLQKETYFYSIRSYFLTGITFAILVPLIVIPEYVTVQEQVISTSIPIKSLPATLSQGTNVDISTYMMTIYALGALFFFSRFVFQLLSLTRFIIKLPKKKKGRFVFIQTKEVSTPFSFFNYIIYPDKGFSHTEIKQILNHEKIHARQYHSLDILISQLVIVFNWFNPLAWLYYKELQKNLEYIADDGVLHMETPKQSYQYLLLKTVSPNYSMALTSNFYNSTIKKRITMLHKNKSANLMYIKFTFIIPVLIAFIMNFNTKIMAQEDTSPLSTQQDEVEIVAIKKDFQQTDLENTKKSLEEKGIKLTYSNLKYNENKEIIAIQVKVSNTKGKKSNLQLSSDVPIQPIYISFNNEKGSLTLGNTKNMKADAQIADKKVQTVHRKIVTDKDGNKSYVVSYGDRVFELKSNVISSTDSLGNQKVVSKNIIVEKHIDQIVEAEVHTAESDKVKHVEVIQIDEDYKGEKILVKEVVTEDDVIDVKVTVLNEEEEDDQGNVHIVSKDGKQPLFILDGEEVGNKKIKDIDPNTIESINVLKGNHATEKYGEKGKDGVVLITLKKR